MPKDRSNINLIIRTAMWMVVLIGVFVTGFLLGRADQHMKTGYFFKLQNEKEFALSPHASLRLQHATKSIGIPFLTPESSILLLEDHGWGQVTLYDARCGFQERGPYVEDVAVNAFGRTYSRSKTR